MAEIKLADMIFLAMRVKALEDIFHQLKAELETSLTERFSRHHVDIDTLAGLWWDEAHQVKMVNLLDIENRMTELEEKYTTLLAHVSTTLPIIRDSEKHLDASKKKGYKTYEL